MNLIDYLPTVPDFPKPGIMFRDISPLMVNPIAFAHTIDLLHGLTQNYAFDYLVAMESRGFIFASALAYASKKPLVMVRKPNKLPNEVFEESYGLEYGSDKLQIQKKILPINAKVLLIDDVLATGGTLLAAKRLIQKSQSSVVAALTVLEISGLDGANRLHRDGVPNQSVIKA